MSTSPNRASNPAGKPRKTKAVALDLPTARQMLPLIKHIIADIVGTQQALTRLAPEQERLDRQRRDLVWQERARRYQLSDEIAAAERTLTHAVGELSELGVNLADPEAGEVDFPTKINGRAAAFCWRMGEDRLAFWHYTGEEQRRPIPKDWEQGAPARYRGQP